MSFQIDSFELANVSSWSDVHLMPCRIEHNGTAKVDQYFKPSIISDISAQGRQFLNASFRGRPLEGRKILLPEGYTGIVLKEANTSGADSEEDDMKRLQITHKFSDMTYWNLDLTPSANDKIMNVMKWINIANVIHSSSSESNSQDVSPSQ